MSWQNFLFYAIGYLWGSLELKVLPKIEQKIDSFLERRQKK